LGLGQTKRKKAGKLNAEKKGKECAGLLTGRGGKTVKSIIKDQGGIGETEGGKQELLKKTGMAF